MYRRHSSKSNKASWYRRLYDLRYTQSVSSFYTLDESKKVAKQLSYSDLSEAYSAQGIRCIRHNIELPYCGDTVWELTTDPWETDYSQSFNYRLHTQSQIEMTSKIGTEFADLGSFYQKFFDEKIPLPYPIPQKIWTLSTAETPNIFRKESFKVFGAGKTRPALVNIFHTPYMERHVVLSTAQQPGVSLVAVSDNFPKSRLKEALDKFLRPLRKATYSISVLFHRIDNGYHFEISDIFYFDKTDYSTLPYEELYPSTVTICQSIGIPYSVQTPYANFDMSTFYGYFRSVDSNAYADYIYLYTPRRFYRFIVMDTHISDYISLDLGFYTEDHTQLIKVCTVSIPNKFSHVKIKMLQKGDHVAALMDVLTPGHPLRVWRVNRLKNPTNLFPTLRSNIYFS